MEIFTNLLRTVMFFVDNIVYGLITVIYKLFIYLSEINLFSFDDSTPLGALIGRIYVLLGIFMLFKVSFSLIQYIIDPNLFSDKSKGFGKLVTNALVTMVLLVSVPYIFTYAMEIQSKIVQSNVIGTLILGENAGRVVNTDSKGNTTSINADTAGEMAEDVQFLLFGAFFSVNPDVIPACKKSPVFGTVAMANNQEKIDDKTCLETLKEEFESDDNDMKAAGVGLNDFFKTGDGRHFDHFDKLLWWQIDGQYAINYLPIISTAAGIYVVFLLISFCIDVAVRAIKLAFLQMIAPIAIVSYIDPKESISNSKLRNWTKECVSTYFSLFLRIATIFLVMVLISTIASSIFADEGEISGQINNIEAGYNMWIYVFLVIGAFVFAKKVPQMIETIFGIKGTGDLSLNPFKNAGMGIGGAMLAGGAAFAGAGAANAIAAGAQGMNIAKQTLGAEKGQRYDTFRRTISGISKEKWNDMSAGQQRMATLNGTRHGLGGVLGIIGGAGSAAARVTAKGETKGLSDIGKHATGAIDATKKARIERDSRQSQSLGTRMSNKVTEFAGIKNEYGGFGKLDADAKALKERLQEADEYQRKASARKIDAVHDIADRNGMFDNQVLNINTADYLKMAQEQMLTGYNSSLGSEEEFLAANKDNIMKAAYAEYQKDVPGTEKSIKAEDFERLSQVNANSDSIRKYEADLKKQLKQVEEAMGKKEDKK